ncbi:MAG: hypothetical protein KGZ85_02525 [Ignavibacterium sp.]|nr:hypothetical protein [Ignavibacterium sp.]
MPKTKEIDIDLLPEDIKRSFIDYYEYLVHKYAVKKKCTGKEERYSEEMKKKKKLFFKSIATHTFNLPEGYKFNREELHER